MPRRHLALMPLLLSLAGCPQIAGSLAHTVFGPPDNDAKYDLQKRPTLVLVENYQDQDASTADGDVVAHTVGDALHDHLDLIVVDPDKLTAVRAEHPANFRQMSIPAIGTSVGAEQVVYVNLIESETSADPTGAAVHATATARVRVVDCKSGNVLWPTNSTQGYEIAANVQYDRSDSDQGSGMRADLLARISDEVGHLFYKWKPDTEEEPQPGT